MRNFWKAVDRVTSLRTMGTQLRAAFDTVVAKFEGIGELTLNIAADSKL